MPRFFLAQRGLVDLALACVLCGSGCAEIAEPSAVGEHGVAQAATFVTPAIDRDKPAELHEPEDDSAVDIGEGDAPAPDGDEDGVADDADNCPETSNPNQCDADEDGRGDVCTPQLGTSEAPFIVGLCPDMANGVWRDSRDTCSAPQAVIGQYPPAQQPQAGPEVVYMLALEGESALSARIKAPEPDGVDVDVHVLADLDSMELIARGHHQAEAVLPAGVYYVVVDTFGSDAANCGGYELEIEVLRRRAGTEDEPVWPGADGLTPLALPFWYEDERDTRLATSDIFDTYAADGLDLSGSEVLYAFVVDRAVRLAAVIQSPEPDGVDIDVHLLAGTLGDGSQLELVTRGDRSVYAVLEAGSYVLALDTFVDGEGQELAGAYKVSLSVRERGASHPAYFNPYILAAVDYLYANHGLLGYDSAVLTHDMSYGDYGVVPATGGTKTMCVAAMMEVILQAMTLYAEDAQDPGVFDYLPLSSWKTLHTHNFKAHLWVNHDLGTWGTADALVNFEMGETVPFEELSPGAFINLNRGNGTGHAVVFMGYIDATGELSATYHESVVGFKYFSAQGGDVGVGGLDYRFAVFAEHGKPVMPYKRDSGIIYSEDQRYLNTGAMFAPAYWGDPTALPEWDSAPNSAFDGTYFTGKTLDDDKRIQARSPVWQPGRSATTR